MNQPPDEFESLRRLIAIKRHEAPPPGYFNDFSSRVITRIEADATAVGLSWWERLWMSLDLKPVVACAYGVGLGGLLFVGFGFVNAVDQEKALAQSSSSPLIPTVSPVPSLPVRPEVAGGRLSLTEQPGAVSSVDPFLSSEPPSGLFSTPSIRVQSAAFFQGRN